MKRGDIYLVDLDPARGSEAAKARPAVLVSNDLANDTASRLGRGVVTVVPLTSNTQRIYSFQVFVAAGEGTGLTSDSKVQAEQVRAVDVRRLIHRLGRLDLADEARLDQALRAHLHL